MRHGKKINHLGRKSAHRKSMIANMCASLIMHKRIRTTLAKAKALRGYVEPLITRSKEDTTHSRRMVFRELQDKDAVTELFREVSTKVAERPGGYTRIIKLGTRLGDNAEMALIELVDYNQNLLGEKEGAKAKATRRGRRGPKKAAEATVAAAPEVKKGKAKEVAPEKPAKEEPAVEETPEPVAKAEEPAENAEPETEPEAGEDIKA
jgi:large subunit ribosomal protein L17